MAQQDTQVISKAVEDFLKDSKAFRSKQDFLQKMAEYEKRYVFSLTFRFVPSNAMADRSMSYS
jgi:hypothetical protein